MYVALVKILITSEICPTWPSCENLETEIWNEVPNKYVKGMKRRRKVKDTILVTLPDYHYVFDVLADTLSNEWYNVY